MKNYIKYISVPGIFFCLVFFVLYPLYIGEYKYVIGGVSGIVTVLIVELFCYYKNKKYKVRSVFYLSKKED